MCILKLQHIPQKTHGYLETGPRDIQRTVTHESTQSIKVANTGGPTKEREDEQTRPQEFINPQEEYPSLYFRLDTTFSLFTPIICTRNRVIRGLMHRDLFINTPSQSFYRLFLKKVETWRWPIKAETCSFICRTHLFKTSCVFDYIPSNLVTHTTGMTRIKFTEVTVSGCAQR